MTKLKGLLALTAALALVACGRATDEAATGTLDIAVSGPGSPAAVVQKVAGTEDAVTLVKSVWMSIDPAAAPSPTSWEKIGAGFPVQGQTRTKLLAGDYTVSIVAYASDDQGGTKLFEGKANATVLARQVSAVRVLLHQVVAPGGVEVSAPQITGISIGGTYAPAIGQPVLLTATVDVPEGTPTYQWTVSCAGEAGAVFSAPTALSTNLTLSTCESDATVMFTVTAAGVPGADGPLVASAAILLPYVKQGVTVGVEIDTKPDVLFLRSTSNAQPVLGQQVSLEASARDADGGPVTFAWSATCGAEAVDAFAPATGAAVTWTAPMKAGPCTVTVTVTDDEGNTNSSTLALNVANPILTVAPFIDVCDSSTWECAPRAAYAGAATLVNETGLYLAKTVADGNGVAFGPNAEILGVAGLPFASVSFDALGNVGAGSPRVRVELDGGKVCTLDKPTVAGASLSFGPLSSWVDASACSGTIARVLVIADMGGQPGTVALQQIQVNGIPVTLPAGGALTAAPYVAVCNSSTWVCTPTASFDQASASFAGGVLSLTKTASDGGGVAFGPNAHVVGVTGQAFTGATFEATGNGIGAGTPRLLLHLAGKPDCALDAPVVTGSAFVFAPTEACGGTLTDLEIIADMGGLVGEVTIGNIVVNGHSVQ